MTKKLGDALKTQKRKTKQSKLQMAGTLGVPLGGQKRVEVTGRNGFVYVKLRDNENEIIQAYNNKVASSYGLPVIVERNNGRYEVVSVNTVRYQNNWTSFAPFLPRHGNTHSFNPEGGGGGDIVWTYSRQLMPILVMPSGSLGAPNVLMASHTLRMADGTWRYVGNTGTQSLLPYKPPVSNQAVMALVYLDSTSGNPYFIVGSGSYFSAAITGSSQIAPYIPTLANNNYVPLAAVRLVTGTATLGWDNIYDVRQWIHTNLTGTTTNAAVEVQDEGAVQGNALAFNFAGNLVQASMIGNTARVSITGAIGVNILDEGVSKGFAGTLNFIGDNVGVSVSGTTAYINITGSAGGPGVSNLTGTSIGTPNAVALTNSSGYLYTDPQLKWNYTSGKLFAEFGANVAGKEANAGRQGYQLFDTMYDIVGAGTGSGARWTRLYDNVYADLIQGGNIQNINLKSTWIYLNATGTEVGPINAPEKTYITGSDYLLGLNGEASFNSVRFPASAILPVAETNTNDIYSSTSPSGTSAFVGTIATLPGGSTLTYNVVSGTERAMVPTSTSQLGKLRLYNTTRGNYALISNCNTVTNTITLTDTVPVGWTVTDSITIASQTVSGGGRSWIDIELTSGPTGKNALFINTIFSSATSGDTLRLHPFTSSFSTSKYIAADAIAASGSINTNVFGLILMFGNVISLSWTGTPTNIVIREAGFLPA